MFQARLARPRPHLDDKVLTAWNGLMIAAFARAAFVLRSLVDDGEAISTPYLDAASRAARFIRSTLWLPESRTLLRRYRAGDAHIEGYAEDYAYLISGLLELFQADPRAEWLGWALELQRRQDELFWDDAAGGWFSTTGQDPTVLLRMKEEYRRRRTVGQRGVRHEPDPPVPPDRRSGSGPTGSRARSGSSRRASSRQDGPCR